MKIFIFPSTTRRLKPQKKKLYGSSSFVVASIKRRLRSLCSVVVSAVLCSFLSPPCFHRSLRPIFPPAAPAVLLALPSLLTKSLPSFSSPSLSQ